MNWSFLPFLVFCDPLVSTIFFHEFVYTILMAMSLCTPPQCIGLNNRIILPKVNLLSQVLKINGGCFEIDKLHRTKLNRTYVLIFKIY